MTTAQRFAFTLILIFLASLANTQAQTPAVSTVNVTPEAERVRVAAFGDVLDMRVTVSDEAGDIVFESGPVTGEHLDWTMRSSEGVRVGAGAYTMTVTYRTSTGKLRRRVEQILVTEGVTGKTETQVSSSPTPTAVGTITGEGAANRVAKFTGANSIGNSAITETGGRLGLGIVSPAQSIHVFGAASRLRLQSSTATALTGTEHVTNNRTWLTGVGGSTAANGVAGKFFIFDQTAGQYRLAIDTAGNVGVGTVAPASKLTVNGSIQILGAANGIKFADGSIQTKAIAGTINGTGTTNRLAKFTGPNSFGNSSISDVAGNVGIGTTTPAKRLSIAGDAELGTGHGDYRHLRLGGGNSSGFIYGSFPKFGDGIHLGYNYYADAAGNDHIIQPDGGTSRLSLGYGYAQLSVSPAGSGPPSSDFGLFVTGSGRVGIGTKTPAASLDVYGDVRLTLHGSGTETVCSTGVGGGFLAECVSSARYKTDVRGYAAGLEVLSRLRPVNYRWKHDGRADFGLIAEEVAEVEPLLTTRNDKGEIRGVKYDRLSVVFINAFKEQQHLIEQQALRNEEQARQIERLQARLNQLSRVIRRRRAAKR